MAEKNKYQGYGYHGGGRKPLPEDQKKVFKTISISGTPDEINRLKELAKSEGKSVSRYVLDTYLNTKAH